VLGAAEIDRFLGVAQRLPALTADELVGLNVVAAGLPIPPKGLF
jgi:2-methylcitrate dehydratase